MTINPIKSFKEMSTGKKVATVAATAAVVAGVTATAVAASRGKKMTHAVDTLEIADKKIKWQKEDDKLFTRIANGFKSFFKKAEKDIFKDAKANYAEQSQRVLKTITKDNIDAKEAKKLVKMFKKNATADEITKAEELLKKANATIDEITGKAPKAQPDKKEAPTVGEAPAADPKANEATVVENQAPTA